jgi:phosphotriesterase-related protein
MITYLGGRRFRTASPRRRARRRALRASVRAAALLLPLLIASHGWRALAQRPPAAVPNLAGKILTVKGPIDADRIGPSLMHEHIFIKRTKPVTPQNPPATQLALTSEPLSFDNLSAVRNYVFSPLHESPYNFFDLTSIEDAIAEVSEFKRWGGDTIVDVSNIGLGRDPHALLQVANATGLHIVMGAGWYQKLFHPPDMDARTTEELTQVIIDDITRGAEGTTVRSGIIGEVGVNGNPLTPNEMKSIRASARASRATGAAITFHGGGYMEEKFTVIDTVAAEGGDVSRIVMGHSNGLAEDLPFMKRLLARGVYIEFDTLGYSEALARSRLGRPDDATVARAIAELIKAGYGDKILLSQDVCTKLQLKKYGGRGFSYIMEFFLPELKRLGVTDDQIHKLMVDNPRTVLTFAAPGSTPTSSASS